MRTLILVALAFLLAGMIACSNSSTTVSPPPAATVAVGPATPSPAATPTLAPTTTSSSIAATTAPASGSPNAGSNLPSISDDEFVAKAGTDGLVEVQIATMAREKAASDPVKQFAARMLSDHAKGNQELTELAKRKNMTIPTDLNAEQQELIARLGGLTGAAFDEAYSKAMLEDHRRAVDLFKTEANGPGDPDLKAFASKTLPTLEEHLKLAEALPANKVSASGTPASASPSSTP